MKQVKCVAIVHYHLRGGGVTRIISHALEALGQQGIRAVVLVGEAPEGYNPRDQDSPQSFIRVIEGLGYSASQEMPLLGKIIGEMKSAAEETLGTPPDIWHFHNHNLGKNALMPAVAAQLAADGENLLLQIHDFPEDGRPRNYSFLQNAFGSSEASNQCLYPSASKVHYATLNNRDKSFLADAGLCESQNHYLPNPVVIPGADEAAFAEEEATPIDNPGRLFLYPTRAIRRKNLGEFLLWAALGEPDDNFAVTLAPKNPAAQPIYNDWVQFAAQLELPVEFEAGIIPGNFPRLIASADAIVTTSIAEGFGLAFLEPWLAGRMLAGRALPEITGEFQEEGIDLSCLYNRLNIPTDWIDRDLFAEKVRVGLEKNYAAYGKQIKSDVLDCALAAAIQNECVDFGCLDEAMQQEIIREVKASQSARDELRSAAGVTILSTDKISREELIKNNRLSITKNYNLEDYGKTLSDIYNAIYESPATKAESLSQTILLDHFLAPERFRLLRT